MIEGEGSIGIGRQSKGVLVQVCNTELETIATLLRLVGDGVIHMRRPPTDGVHQQVWSWHLTGNLPVQGLLPQIVPYLTGKRNRAEQVLGKIAQAAVVPG